MQAQFPIYPKVVYSVAEIEAILGLAHSTIYQLINTGELGSAKIGKRRVITQAQVDRFITSLENQTLDGAK